MKKIFYSYNHLIISLLVFVVYLTTVSPTVTNIDNGELATVQATLGIAHPTGYPLYTIIGYLFSLLPLPVSIIYQLNILAAIYCAAGVAVFIKSGELILLNLVYTPKSAKNKKKQKTAEEPTTLPTNVIKISSTLAGLLLGFGYTFWQQATATEVYALHILTINLAIFFLLKSYFAPKENNTKYWLYFAFVLALSFSNHMTTILIIPATAYLFFLKEGFNITAIKKLGYMLGLFFPVLFAIYAYLPLRASADPLINWGNPETFDMLLRHVMGKQYSIWLFSSTDAAAKQFAFFRERFLEEYAYIGVVLLLLPNLFFTWNRKILYFILICFAFTVLYSINYDIKDIETYFLLAFISIPMFIMGGIASLLYKYSKFTPRITGAVLVVILFVSGFNYGKTDQSDLYMYEDYTKTILGSVEDNAIVFSYQWDFFVSQSYYFQFVENYKRNVSVIDKELLRRSWYYPQLKNCYPGITEGIQPDVNVFLKALEPFEKGEPFNSKLLETYFRRIMTGLVSTNIAGHPFYVAPEIVDNEIRKKEFTLPEGYTIVPHNFLYKVVKGDEYVKTEIPNLSVRFNKNEDYYTTNVRNMLASVLLNRAVYEVQFKEYERSKAYVELSKKANPKIIIPNQLIQILENYDTHSK